jgi:hypothetical protein
MSDQCGILHIVESGDTNDSIVKEFSLTNWAEVYHHPKNAKYRQKCKESDPIKAGEIVWVPSRNVLATKTSTSGAVKQPIWRFFFNAHMHIQSNNCCPMPLQWGILTKVIHGMPVLNLFVQERTSKSRKAMNELARGFIGSMTTGRLGKIGGLSTDLIAGIYKGDLKNTDMNEDMVWTVMDEEKYNALKNKKGSEAIKKAGEKAKLQSLSTETDAAFKDSFYAPTEYYYHNAPLTMFNSALLMDMSLAHYWGQWHIPVTINCKTEAAYINDWCTAYVNVYDSTESDKLWEERQRIDAKVIEPKASGWNYSHLYAKSTHDKDFSIGKALEQYRTFLNRNSDKKKHESKMLLVFENSKTDEVLCAKEFVHIVDRIPDGTPGNIAKGEKPNELKWFEDYSLQKKLSEGAAVKYPMEFFLFYHYDPRRHCQGDSVDAYADLKSKEIISKHAFYRYDQPEKPESDKPTTMLPAGNMNTPDFWKGILIETLILNNTAFNSLHYVNPINGIYWGVKTYPRLGYDPADFNKYPQLREMYQKCGKNIPLLTHCSRGGMAGADYYCYAKYNPAPAGLVGKDKERFDALTADPSNLDHTEFWYADTFAAPGNWENVLNQFPSLRLCLAHFGGYDTWCQVGVFEDIESLYPTNPGIFPKGEEIESDAPLGHKAAEKEKMRATLYHAWIKKIAELAETKDNVYADLSYFHLAKDLEPLDIQLKNRPLDKSLLISQPRSDMVDCKKLVAKNIIYLLGKFPKLKDKIIIGTDWYMIEQESQIGVGDILRNLFIVMEMVSEEVGYDAWHQFAVINPMRYLGLGKEEGVKLRIDNEKLKKYSNMLLNQFSDDQWIKKSRVKSDFNSAEKRICRLMNRVELHPVVPDSGELINQ